MKVGDKVVCVDNSNNRLPVTIGKEYEVFNIGLVGGGVQVEVDPLEFYYSRKHIFPYRLVKPTKTLRSVVEEVTGNVDAIVSAIEENFEVTPKQGENK